MTMENGAFVEENCTIEHEGRAFKAGGAFICNCSDGYARGHVYAKRLSDYMPGDTRGTGSGIVTTWKGEEIAKAHFFPAFHHNMSGRFGARRISFWYKGVYFIGQKSEQWDLLKVKSTKKAKI